VFIKYTLGLSFILAWFLLGAITNTYFDDIEPETVNHYALVHTGEPYLGFQSYPYKNIIIKGK
jgi:hypothetical protein